MTTYITNIKKMADFNYIDLENYNFPIQDGFKIEDIIKSAYTFDGEVTINLIKCAIRNIVGYNEYKISESIYPLNNKYYKNKVIQDFEVKDKDSKLLFFVHIFKNINQLGEAI